MVECPEAAVSGEVYVAKPVADPELLADYDVVAIKIEARPSGSASAVAPLWKLVGWNGKDAPALGDYVGHVLAQGSGGLQRVPCAPRRWGVNFVSGRG